MDQGRYLAGAKFRDTEKLLDSPLSTYSHRSISDPGIPVSLDTVVARLEKADASTDKPDRRLSDSQSARCLCMQRYTELLYQLQTIEKWQYPVQVDTLLTCANIVLNIITDQHRCSTCLHDTRVWMQLVLIFQTIFIWTQRSIQVPESSFSDMSMTLGRHELTREECVLAKTALLTRALHRINVALKSMVSRLEYIITERQEKQSWVPDTEELQNTRQLATSLKQKYAALLRRTSLPN